MKTTFRRAAVIALAAAMGSSILPPGSAFAAGNSGSAPALVSYDVNGNGTIESGEKAYRIETADQLDWFSSHVNAGNTQSNAFLANNIDLSTRSGSEPFRPISAGSHGIDYTNQNTDYYGALDFGAASFAGVFDGNGKSVRNLYINNSDEHLAGLFGSISENGEVRNLSVYGTVSGIRAGGIAGDLSGKIINCSSYVNVCENSNVTDGVHHYSIYCAGGIAGYIKGGIVEQCCNYGMIEAMSTMQVGYKQGGIAGYMVLGAVVSDCFNYGNVHGAGTTGGIGGFMETSTLVRCCGNEGEVTGTGTVWSNGSLEKVGGITGFSYGWIENCYNTGSVTGMQRDVDTGGLVGAFAGSITYDSGHGYDWVSGADKDYPICIKNCYNIGSVDNTGLNPWRIDPLGWNYNGTGPQIPVNCYYASDRTSAFGTHLSLTEFANEANFTGWDFDHIWIMDPVKGRPVLRASNLNGTIDTTALEGSEHRRGNLSKGDFFIRSKANGRYLDLAASSYTTLICHSFNGGNNQKFEFRQGCLKSLQNGKFITVGAAYNGGLKAVVDTSASVSAIQRVDADSYRIIKTLRDKATNTTKTYALEVQNPNASSSLTVWKEYQPNNVNQLWILEDALAGIYTIKNAKSGRVLDVYEANGNLLQHSANGGNNQKWKVIPQGNGYYKIQTMSTVYPGYLNRGANGRAVVSTDGWTVSLDKIRDGVFRITNWSTGLIVENGSMNDAKVLWRSGSGANDGSDEWILESIS